MTENRSNVRINLQNTFGRNRHARSRTEFIANKATINTWVASDLSKPLDSDSESAFRSSLERLTTGKSEAEHTSVESLRNWANTKNGCRLGELIITNVPVNCSGVLQGAGMESQLTTREGYTELPKHMRWSAHGLTFGSVYAKAFRGTSSTGESFVKEISLFVACNNCLDLWVGETRKNDRRSDNLWPFVHTPRVHSNSGSNNDRSRSGNRKTDRKSSKKEQTSRPARNAALSFILSNLQPHSFKGKKQDPWRKVTATMLKAFLTAQAHAKIPSRKGELVAEFGNYIRESGDVDTSREIDLIVNSD